MGGTAEGAGAGLSLWVEQTTRDFVGRWTWAPHSGP